MPPLQNNPCILENWKGFRASPVSAFSRRSQKRKHFQGLKAVAKESRSWRNVDSKGDSIRMRTLDPSDRSSKFQPAIDTTVRETPADQRASNQDAQDSNGAPRSFSRSSRTTYTPESSYTPDPSPPTLAPDYLPRSSASMDDAESLAATTPAFLPPQLAADIATDRGSREFIMDSEFRWAQDSYNSVQRTIETWTFITILRVRLYLIEQRWTYFSGYSEAEKSQRRRKLATWCLEQILELGPTFIKLGQLFSTRSDLFPSEYIEELSKLQDRVPAFSSTKAIDIVEKELGDSVGELFQSFDSRPIAAASLGQVHRATLHSGEEVVVKVQRPGLRRLFEIDMNNMGRLAALLDRADPNADNIGIYKECRTILFKEIDYINEGKNADRFRRNFQPYDWVKIPTVKWQFTSPQVITLEYVPGLKISSVTRLIESGLDVRDIAVKSTQAYIIQVLQHGFLHSDPHSGNLAVSPDGKLIWYDFGMMSEIAPYTKDRLLQLFYAVAQQDADGVITSLTDLKVIVPTTDTLSLKRAIVFFLDNINRQAERQETLSAIAASPKVWKGLTYAGLYSDPQWASPKTRFQGSCRNCLFLEAKANLFAGEDLFSLAVDQPFRFPAAFTFVLRAFSSLEGIGKLLIGADQYSFAAIAKPYAQELLDRDSTQNYTIRHYSQQAVDFSMDAAQVPGRVGKLEKFAKNLEEGTLKLRVRDSANERALRRSRIMQTMTFQSIAVAGLLNVGVQLQLADKIYESYPAYGGAAFIALAIAWGFRRLKKLDIYEQEIRRGSGYDL